MNELPAYDPEQPTHIRKIEHRIGELALWGDIRQPDKARKCRVLDYGPVQGTRMIRLTDRAHDRYDYDKNKMLCVDLGDVWERKP